MSPPVPPRPASTATARACVVGLGNIGSQLVPLLARSGVFGTLTLVDPDVYDAGNLRTQNILPGHVGMAKAEVQALLARAASPGLAVMPICEAVEDVPLGRLRADVIFSAPDTRRARQHVNRIVWRLGARAWIDAGIEPSAQLVRVSLYAPRATEPCLECAWGPDDYAVAGDHVSCTDASVSPAPATNGPPALGALVAARAVLLCEQLFSDADGHLGAGLQIVLAVREHRLTVTTFRRNPACRFDHSSLPLESLTSAPLTTPLGEAGTWIAGTGGSEAWRLGVDGCGFATRLFCPACGFVRDGLRLLRPRSGAALRCDCGAGLTAAPLDAVSRLARDGLTDQHLDMTFADLGLRSGDIVTIAAEQAERSIEMAEQDPGVFDACASFTSCDHATPVPRALR